VRHGHRRARLAAARGTRTWAGLGTRTRTWGGGDWRLRGAVTGLAFRRPGSSLRRLRLVGRQTAAPRGPTLGCAQSFGEPADHRRFDGRARRTDELPHLLELGHDDLALYAELLSELVYPDLRHCTPLLGPGGWLCRPDRRYLDVFIAACSSGAHSNLTPPINSASYMTFRGSPSRCARTREKSSGPGTRNARGSARRRSASSRQLKAGCSDAPRPGSRPRRSGTT
jgi:hypothetical protein